MEHNRQAARRMGVYQALTPQFKRLADEYGTEEVIRTLQKVGGDLQDVQIMLENIRQSRQFRGQHWDVVGGNA